MDICRLAKRIGFRGVALLLLGTMDIGYGAALIHSHDHRDHPIWWPGEVRFIAGLPVGTWGFVWILIGLFVLTGSVWRYDRWQFAAAVMIKVVWAIAALGWWWNEDQPGGWAIPMVFVTFSLIVLLISAWPEPSFPEEIQGDEDASP